MAQSLQVNLSFTADSAKAKAQIQDLQNSLNNLMRNNPTGKVDLPVTKELLKAQQAAAQLSISLKNATDVNTGKLNLTQFSSELQKSGMTLEKYRTQLSALGPEGEKTFLNLAKSVMTADSAIKTSNKLVNDLWISLKNTAKWQLSSSMVKGFMGAISTAFNYAEDLNKSLNQIQIVTGNSAEQMARFAKQANIAAKELSTTTTAYTDASLIYYQQGLDDASVKARTDITIKAANAAGTNAAEMSDYLTAVWNSYKVGSNELERYVDVMAALGAGTATSLEEISTAMEKVASVGEATGVKFEQMSSIIATVSSVTRQSAETVGTAFKTIFARMADLKLEGSIEEDGVITSLGTVSKQLAQVGINILDANGELRNMGDVTEELMGKWNGMNEATQQAVAIAIAGKRQYTQLLALMNNQDMYRDAMAMATGAEGTLQEQADTYAKSWEAAQKRVKAAAQGIYDSLINDDFFIGMNNGIADVLGMVEKLIDSMGGFSGVLSGLGMLAFKVFDKQINEGLQKSIQSMYSMSAAGQHQNDLLRQQAVNQVKAVYADRSSGNLNTYEQTDLDIQQKRFDLQTQLMNNAKMMSEDEIKLAQAALDTNKAYAERATALAQIQTELEEQFNENKENAQFDIIDNFDFDWGVGDQKVAEFDELIQKYKDGSLEIKQAFQFDGAETDIFQIDDALKQLFDSAEGGAKIQLRDLKIEVNSLVDEFTSGSISEEEYTKKLEQLKSKIASVAKSMNTSRETFIEQAEAMGVSREQAERLADIIPQLKKAEDNTAVATENFNQSCQNLIQGLERTKTTTAIFAEGLLGTMRAVSSLGMALSTLKGAWNTLNDPDMSGFEKVLSIMTSLEMGIPALVSSINLFKESWHGVAEGLGKVVTATAKAIAAQTAQKAATDASRNSTIAKMTTEELAIAVETEKRAAEGLSLKQKLLYIAAQKLGVHATAKEVAENSKAVVAKIAHTAADTGLTIGQTLLAAATAAVNGQFMIMFSLLAPLLAPLLSIAGAVTALVIVFNKLKKETPEEKLEKASDRMNALSQASEEATQRVDELNNSLNNLKTAQDNIDKLIKGTSDWKQAIHDTNAEVLELIKNFPELGYGLTTDENGQLQLDQEQVNYVKKQEQNRANNLVYLSSQAASEFNKQKDFNDSLKLAIDKISKDSGLYQVDADLNKTYELYKKYGEQIFDNSALSKERIAENVISGSPLQQREAPGYSYQTYKGDLTAEATQNAYFEGRAQLWQNAISPYSTELINLFNKKTAIENSSKENMKLLADSAAQLAGLTKGDVEEFEKLYTEALRNRGDKADKDAFMSDMYGAKGASYEYDKTTKKTIFKDKDENELGSFTDEEIIAINANFEIQEDFAKQSLEKARERLKELIGQELSNFSDEEIALLANNESIIEELSDENLIDLSNLDQIKQIANLFADGTTKENIKEVGEQIGLTGVELEDFVDTIYSASDSLNFLNRDISGLINSLSNQEELTDEQKQLLDDLKDAYPELKDATDDYADSFINNLNIIQNDLEALDIKSKAREMKDLVKELNLLDEEGNIRINIDDRNFNDTLDQILDQSYEIEVAIKTDIDSDIANMQSALDKMQNATNLISESWRVSQQDLQELASIYPGILRQSEILADGTVQLNSKIAQGAIEAANADLQANKNTALGKLEMEKAFLTAKLGYLQNMSDAVDILNDNEVASDEEKNNAKASLEKNLSDLIALCQGDNAEVSSSVAASRVVDENQVGKAGSENAQESDTNWIAAYQSITKASAESARARIQNENAVATAIASGGKTSGEVSEGNISSTYSGSHTDSTYSNDTQVKTEGSNAGKIADLQGLIANADYSSLGKRISQDQSSVIKQLGIVEDAMTIVQSISKTAEYNSQYASTGGSGGSGSSGGSGGGGKGGSGGGGKGGSGGGKGGSGGGKSDSGKDKSGSSSRRPETADLKNLDEEITRYKNVDNQLASIENHLDKISHKKDQAYGKKYIDALYEENEALQKQIDLHRQSQSDAIKYQAWDKQKVAELGFNIETDEAGYVTNEEQFDAWITQNENAIELGYTNSVNALGEDSDDQRNALEEQKKAQLDNIEAAKTYFNLYKEATERRYKDESDIEELLAQQRENNYDAINKKLEIQMDLLDRERNHMEFLRNTFREGFFGIADNLENDRAQFGNLTQQMNDLQTTMAEVQEKFNTGQISESQYIELMQNLSDRAEEAGTSLYELSEQIVGRFSEALEGANEILDNTIDKFEHLRGLSDSVINLMKLTYGEEAYKKLDPMLKNQEKIAKNQLSATRQIYYEAGEWLESKRLAYEAVKGQGDQEEDAAKRMYDEALDNYNERQSQYYEALTAAAEAAMVVYENSVNKSLQDYENKLTDGLGFDALQQQLNHLQEMDELYLTNENQQYRTQKLIRTALNDMDKTENKVAKNKIELFIKQTRELQKQGKLSEYQMSIKEKEYNILLAQLALEDAQNNKSQVRLQRDSEGNFNYVYTADENNLLEKQQEVDDAINDLYNYEREMVNEMNQRALDSAKEAGEQLREIAEQYGTDSKEYIEAQQRLLAEHGEVITAIKEHMTITQNSIDQSYLDSYNLIIDDEIAITDNWKNTFVKTSNEIKTASQTLQKDTNLYMREMNNDYIKVKDTSNDLRQEVSTNLNQISPIMNKVALDTSYWAVNMNEYLGSVAAAYENIANACATAAHTISGYMPDIDYHREFVNETDMNKMSSLLSTRQYITKNNIDGRAIWGMNTEGGLDLFNGINYAEVIQNTAIQGLGDTIAINAVANAAAHRIIKMQESGNYYNSVTGTEKLLKKIFGDGDIFNAIVDAMKENNNFIGFDTGGYTGDFGPEGKFAILHEKELVLNQQDTQNLLDTVDIVDKLLNSLEYQNLLYDFNISNIGNGINKNKDTLEQDVTIHAEFPNVQDHNEIEMALSNLVNTASQYANRKKS